MGESQKQTCWEVIPQEELRGNGALVPLPSSLRLPYGPDSRVTGLGDKGAQLLDPVVNVESPATLNFGGERGEE